MHRQLPPIAKLARRVLMVIEEAVTRFPRRHKYTVGSDLRREAMRVSRCVIRAWRDRQEQVARVRELVVAVDDLKLTVQLGKDVNAFRLREFEPLAVLVVDLGRQVGGWLKALHDKGQNEQAVHPPAQRPRILSACDTPSGVIS